MVSTGWLRERLPPAPIGRYYAFTAARRAAFTVPIFVLFFRARGLSMAQVGAVEATYTVVVLLAETPTGYVGDRLGRRDTMLVGTVLSAAGAVGYALAHTFVAFLAVSSLRAVAGAFASGATGAWLYDTLGERADEGRFAHVQGRARTLGIASHGAAAIAGSALYGVSHLLPWLVEAAVVGAGAAVLLTIPEPETGGDEIDGDQTDGDETEGEETDGDEQASPSIRRVAGVARQTLSRRAVGAFVLYTGLLFGLLNTVEIYVQPVSVEVVGIAPAGLGLVYAGFTVLAAAVASQAGRIEETVGTAAYFGVVPPLLGGVLLAVAVVPPLALPAFFLARAAGAASGPLAGQYLNDRTPSAGRATVLSAASMVRSLFTAPLNVLGGALAVALALPHALAALGAVLAGGSLLVLGWRFPVVEEAAGGDREAVDGDGSSRSNQSS